MPKYRKRPVVIEAMQVLDDLANHTAIRDWARSSIPEGQDEFYPCKPDIFEATYEPVEESA